MRNATPFQTLDSYKRALNEMGQRRDGPSVLAISASDMPAFSPRNARREGCWHRHHRGQVICVEDGMLQVRTEAGAWLVPPRQAAWVPPGLPHAANSSGVTHSWNLYLSPAASRTLPREPCVVAINALV